MGLAKTALSIAIILLVISIVLGVASLYPGEQKGYTSIVLVDDSFNLSPNEIFRQGLGTFRGNENITLQVNCTDAFVKDFSIVTYSGTIFTNNTDKNIAITFHAASDYYEAIFSNATQTGAIHFYSYAVEPQNRFPYLAINEFSKILFIISLTVALLALLKLGFSTDKFNQNPMPSLNEKNRRRLIVLLLISLIFWFGFIVLTQNSLGTLENWYTDHPRHTYVSGLFLKDGFSIFNTPLIKLSSLDNSYFKFVTWPEMPHLYSLGSVLVFLPFGVMVQNGYDQTAIYKMEIALFLVVATVCLYIFLKSYLEKDLHWLLRAVGIYIIYFALIVYAADGMFDSIAFLFCLLALSMFLSERYDYFFLLVGAAVFFKYQAGIFLLPLIIIGLVKIFQKTNPKRSLSIKAVVVGACFLVASAFTAYLSMPYLFSIRPHFILNSINAFSSNTQIPWSVQSFFVFLTLGVTLVYSFYMLKKNTLLSLSALFLLVPSLMLPYFQNWYLPYIFIYTLIPQKRTELLATVIWLLILILILSLGWIYFNPVHFFDNLRITFHF